jgi:hypothetical protein
MRWRQFALSTALMGICIWCVGLVQKAYSEEKAPAPQTAGYRPVAPVEPLMQAQKEQYNALRSQLQTAGKEDFRVIQQRAYILAELCNVNHYQSDKADYRKWAFEARDLSLALAQAAKSRDAAQARNLLKQINNRCALCHDAYQ